MTFFAIIGLLLLVISFFVYISTIVIGIFIGVGINVFSMASRDKIAPIWWDILAVIVTIWSSVMLWKDIASESIDYGPRPFLLLIGFGVASMLLIFIISAIKNKPSNDDYPVYTRTSKGIQVKTPSKPKKKVIEARYSINKKDDTESDKDTSGSSFVRPPEWKIKETWEDYPAPDYDAMHTYCQVAFDDSGKYFYYRTRNPELKVGDMVYVPVGYKYQKKIGNIISMKEYKGSKAPYPLERTKHIIGKVES